MMILSVLNKQEKERILTKGLNSIIQVLYCFTRFFLKMTLAESNAFVSMATSADQDYPPSNILDP